MTISSRDLVLEYFKKTKKHMTTDQVKMAFPKIHQQTINSAVSCLAQGGYLIDTGKRIQTRFKGGRIATVYKYQSKRKRLLDNGDDIEWQIDPKHHYTAYLLRADQARAFALVPYKGKVDKEMIELAKIVVKTWSELIIKLEERRHGKQKNDLSFPIQVNGQQRQA